MLSSDMVMSLCAFILLNQHYCNIGYSGPCVMTGVKRVVLTLRLT